MSTITPSVPPGTIIASDLFKNLPIGQINFADKSSTTPLSPLVEATYFEVENTLNVSAVLFLDSSIQSPAFTVYQYYGIDVDGQPIVQFFIAYDYKETQAQVFNAFQLNFQVNPALLPSLNLSDIKTVQTFLWDTDPVTSRGTVTTVQKSHR